MRLSISSTVAALCALATTATLGANASAAYAAPSVLHRLLDSTCMRIFAKACANNPHFCVPAVARRDVGFAGQPGDQWRCYSQNELDFSLTKMGCVDDCGQRIRCAGAVKEASLEHLTHDHDLAAYISTMGSATCKLHKIVSSS